MAIKFETIVDGDSGYVRGQEHMLARILDTPLPCDVKLAPCTTFAAGVTLRTLFAGLRERPSFDWNTGPVMGNTWVLVKTAQYVAIGKFVGQPGSWWTDAGEDITIPVLGWMS